MSAGGLSQGHAEAAGLQSLLLQFEIDRCRALYASADLGVAMLPPASARCIRAARVLYSRILERIEAQSYDVFSSRASVPTWQKAATAAGALLRG